MPLRQAEGAGPAETHGTLHASDICSTSDKRVEVLVVKAKLALALVALAVGLIAAPLGANPRVTS